MKQRILAFLMFAFLFNSLRADPLDMGASIPAITVTLENSEEVQLDQVAESSTYLLVYFYPKANTSGCTAQACSLRDAFAQLTEHGVTVLGASKDKVKSQASFKAKYELPFHLIADTDAKLIKAFGVPSNFGFAARQAFLFKDGVLVWRDLSASTSKQADDILQVLQDEAS